MHGRIGDDEQAMSDEDFEALLSACEEPSGDRPTDEHVTLTAEQLRRAELAAYAKGWQDAEEAIRPELERAREALTRRLRIVHSADRPADILPFRRPSEGDEAPSSPESSEASDDRPAPRFDRKNPGSRTPTIPSLRPRRRTGRPRPDENRPEQ